MEKRTRGKRNEIATEFYFRDTNRNTKDKFVKGNAGRKKTRIILREVDLHLDNSVILFL